MNKSYRIIHFSENLFEIYLSSVSMLMISVDTLDKWIKWIKLFKESDKLYTYPGVRTNREMDIINLFSVRTFSNIKNPIKQNKRNSWVIRKTFK